MMSALAVVWTVISICAVCWVPFSLLVIWSDKDDVATALHTGEWWRDRYYELRCINQNLSKRDCLFGEIICALHNQPTDTLSEIVDLMNKKDATEKSKDD